MKKDFTKNYRKVGKVRSLKEWQDGFVEIIDSISEELSLSKKDVINATDLGFRYYNTGKNISHNRFVVVAGAVYIATALSGDRRSQERICKVINVTTTSVRRCYRDICDKLNLEGMEEDANMS